MDRHFIEIAVLCLALFTVGLMAGILLQRGHNTRQVNPCITTYEADGHNICVLDEQWGAFIR